MLGAPDEGRIAGQRAEVDGPASMATSRGSSAANRAGAVAGSTPMASKSTGQGAGGHPQAHPTGMAGGQPRRLLGHQRRGPEWEEQGVRQPPTRRGSPVEDERRHLLGIGQIAGEPTVVLTGHDPVESPHREPIRAWVQSSVTTSVAGSSLWG